MSGTSIDHIVSFIAFIAAILIFIGLFGNTIQSALTNQQYSAMATKTSDLLDNILLNPGNPSNWSQTDWNQPSKIPTQLGLQDPAFTEYDLSALSVMRLDSVNAASITYQGQTYRNLTAGSGSSLLIPANQIINSSLASQIMGINASYAFSLAISPTIQVSVSEVSFNPLNVSVVALGQGLPLSNAQITYCLAIVTGGNPPQYPSVSLNYGTGSTDASGSAYLNLSSFNMSQASYAIIVYVSLSGTSGIGYFVHSQYTATTVVPIISSIENRQVQLADSYGINSQGFNGNITYTATFLRSPNFIQASLNNGYANVSGTLFLSPTPNHAFDTITIDPNNLGVLVVGYTQSTGQNGVTLMPWGFGSTGSSITLGTQTSNQKWISTDIRQVLINGISYQAKLALWSSVVGGS